MDDQIRYWSTGLGCELVAVDREWTPRRHRRGRPTGLEVRVADPWTPQQLAELIGPVTRACALINAELARCLPNMAAALRRIPPPTK